MLLDFACKVLEAKLNRPHQIARKLDRIFRNGEEGIARLGEETHHLLAETSKALHHDLNSDLKELVRRLIRKCEYIVPGGLEDAFNPLHCGADVGEVLCAGRCARLSNQPF